MSFGKHVLVSLALLVACASASVESGNSVENSTQVTGRSGRKDQVAYSQSDKFALNKVFYSPEESQKNDRFEPIIVPRLSKDDATQPPPAAYEEYVPDGYYVEPRPNPRYYAPGPMHKSGSSVNWNVWKGNPNEGAPSPVQPAQTDKGAQVPDFSEYYFPSETWKGDAWKGDAWKGDPWMPSQMPAMMMMMNQMQAANKPKFGGFLSKLAQEPAALLIAAILPFSILLSAVLPSLINMMMNGGLPTITTTASGNSNNGRSLDSTEFLSPVLQTITAFGGRAFDNPDCMQRIFCQVTKGPSSGNGTEATRSFQRSLYSASKLIDSHWLETFGVKRLFNSMADGNCEKIPCSTHGSSSHKKT